jgi:hypothetical protein
LASSAGTASEAGLKGVFARWLASLATSSRLHAIAGLLPSASTAAQATAEKDTFQLGALAGLKRQKKACMKLIGQTLCQLRKIVLNQ